ncbi:hypothetical protein, partial [Prevotella sp. oral taxon 317]|uniref:hypothetical protein n=1 Tax=Prevotella sp. oral taxon 317 TaxID=652721 RepID=UPI001E41A9F0
RRIESQAPFNLKSQEHSNNMLSNRKQRRQEMPLCRELLFVKRTTKIRKKNTATPHPFALFHNETGTCKCLNM